MIKFLTITFAFFLIFKANAGSTIVTITPTKPARCDLRDYTLINMVYELSKVENANEIILTFKTSIGSCQKNEIRTFKYTGYQDILFYKEGLTLPWSYLPKTEILQESKNAVKIIVTFDKSKTFKKKSQRHMQFTFKPGHFEDAEDVIAKILDEYYRAHPTAERNLSTYDYINGLTFIWNIKLSYNIDDDRTALTFE